MDLTFKNILTGEEKKMVEGVDYTVESRAECDFCLQSVNAIDLELTQVPSSTIMLWACDECRKATKEGFLK